MKRSQRERLSALLMALLMLTSILPLSLIAEEEFFWDGDEAGVETEYYEQESPDDYEDAGDFFMPEKPWDDADSDADDEDQAEEEPDAVPDEPLADDEEDVYEPAEETVWEENEEEPAAEMAEAFTVRDAFWQNGHAYVVAQGPAPLWRAPGVNDEQMFTIEASNAVLLATEYVEQEYGDFVRVWLMTEEYEILSGYISVYDLAEYALTDDQATELSTQLWAWPVETEIGAMVIFVVEGDKPAVAIPVEEPEAEIPDVEDSTDQPLPEEMLSPDAIIVTDEWDSFLSEYSEESDESVWIAQPGEYIAVTTDTRSYLCVDDTIEDEYGYDGDNYTGHFVNDAVLQVEEVLRDSFGQTWYKAAYKYGDALDNGKYLWTDVQSIYVLAAECVPTDETELTITDHAYRFKPPEISFMSMDTTYMNGFSLRYCSASAPYVYAGQSGVYATSGHDNEYPQIASLPGHGTIFATPHYINNCVVYCLEHTMPGPNQSDGDGGRHPTGPYNIVDLDTYEYTPGPSGYIFKTQTMHAIAWVLRHTVPFMELARSDSNNRVWSRVAGQFAIREVICEMEGDFYVRDYWIMDDFVRQAGQAPAVYLTYARWLAENGIAYGRRSGNITVTNKSMRASGGSYVATATLTTDAEKMRISRDVGTLTGNSGGSDWQYYYLYSGDTISVVTNTANLSFVVQSLPSSEDEANFLVGVPEVEIQKVLIPQDGDPVPFKSVMLSFDVPMGSLSVTKKSSSGSLLSGAVIELLNSSGSVIATQTTGSNGVTTFSNLQPGTYTVREKTAPQGYLLAANSSQQVQVTAGGTASATFTNDPITGKIRINKTDSSSGKPLPGATFSVTRLTGPSSEKVSNIGQVVATITTNAQGIAETGLLPWGEYRVVETGVPAGYLNPNYSTTVTIK